MYYYKRTSLNVWLVATLQQCITAVVVK